MSTKLTRKSPNAGYDLVDSHALSLTQATESFRNHMVQWLLSRLHEDGFPDLKASQLTFMGSLDCGVNFAAELARTLQVSRQAIHKTVRELENSGWLATRPDEALGNQRVIVFTDEGERIMACVRGHFLTLDKVLIKEFGEDQIAEFQKLLNFDLNAI
ncbi:hypothetical protein GCM10007939_19450 [Amylibacter marinus]|uniref:HTH marR-type domain-containing protein n=1 Tax=Amylibacter marinus TaxID=1475483 RepID=A0ABQ5VWJ2_9RHOB|nr:MarR family winged helix-turn-helix transcriptional regulator [Amylibacter marinus]GLQ35662.1 hypothetical protein GCM10007939_19450 [Amylibacter marinus]